MSDATTFHRRAMEFAEEAMLERVRGNVTRAAVLFRDAFEMERAAATLVGPDTGLEPTRSVLHRSAAQLALECGDVREARRLVDTALLGSPPPAIAKELGDLARRVEVAESEHHAASKQ